jgi:hypothetical protein
VLLHVGAVDESDARRSARSTRKRFCVSDGLLCLSRSLLRLGCGSRLSRRVGSLRALWRERERVSEKQIRGWFGPRCVLQHSGGAALF